jgi:U3 small nucleolar RNA-associated protein 25
VCEYSRDSEISRGRSLFFHGKKKLMLYSGRAHFFRRFRIRGALHMIFYSLPEYAHFYPEIVNILGEAQRNGSTVSCLVLFTAFEKMALERIVGVKRCQHMMSSAKTTFMFK